MTGSSVLTTSHNPLIMDQRTCKDCVKEFPLTGTFFYVNKLSAGGFDPRCKSCRKEYQRKLNFVNRKIDTDVPEGFKKCHKCKDLFPKKEEYFRL